jgi:HAE1 family hydrophobic/amphiphilic exporter-1
MTLSLSAVFIPVLFMGGLLGRLLHEFAVTIVVAVLVSGFVSLTLDADDVQPVHPLGAREKTRPALQRLRAILRRHAQRLRPQFADGHAPPAATLNVSLAVLVATLALFVVIPKGFFPDDDTGQIFGITEAAQGISFDAMREHQMAVAKIAAADPNVAELHVVHRRRRRNNGRIFMRLKPRSERKLNANQIIQELRPKFAQIPGINVYLQNPPLIRVGGMLSKALYQFSLQDTDTKELYHWSPILMNKMAAQTNVFQDVTSDLLIANPQVMVEIDRDKASALGVTAGQIENALYDAYGERQSSTIYTDINEYWVILEVEPQFQRDPDALGQLYITSSVTDSNGLPEACSAQRRRPAHAQPRADEHFPRRPVAVRHHLLQPRARRFPRHRRRTGAKTPGRPASAGDHQRQLSRLGAGFPVVLARTHPCSSWPFSSSTSSWGSFTKASSIPSPFCPACPRRALARC